MIDPRSLRALLVGSLSCDVSAVGCEPGGVVHHAGLALRKLGVAVRVVTRLRASDAHLLAPLRDAGALVHWSPSRDTTTYRNRYGPNGDEHELLARSDPITATDLPQAFLDVDFVQLGPLHPEDIAPSIAAIPLAPQILVGIDVQGYARGSGTPPEGRARAALAISRAARVVQLSAAEIEPIFGVRDPAQAAARLAARELVVTHGAGGAEVFSASARTVIDARPVTSAAPGGNTGAGDVFLACYLWQRRAGASIETASRRAAAVAAIKIENGELPTGIVVEELAA